MQILAQWLLWLVERLFPIHGVKPRRLDSQRVVVASYRCWTPDEYWIAAMVAEQTNRFLERHFATGATELRKVGISKCRPYYLSVLLQDGSDGIAIPR